jgi:histidinol-phosphatase
MGIQMKSGPSEKMTDLDDLMQFAVSTTEAAGAITLRHFGSAAVEFKGDGSEVTAADHASEAYIRATIEETFPEDGMLGEEGSIADGRSRRRWIFDPIDGTRSFASGVPLYGVLLALEVDGVPVLGCCHFPPLGKTLVAATGAGAWFDGRPARVSGVDRLEDARLVTSGLEYWRDWASEEGLAGWQELTNSVRTVRTWGDCFGYFLVATGRAEIMADVAAGSLWDLAPMIPILSEAGGRFSTFGDGPPAPWRSALASNGLLHQHAGAFWDRDRGDAAVQIPSIRARG